MSKKGARGWLFAFSLIVATSAALGAEPAENPPPRGAYMAAQCTDARVCPLLDEVYATTPAFRHALALSLRHGNEIVPEWVKDKLPGATAPQQNPTPPTTASAMLPLRIDERAYLLGRMRDPENPDRMIAALYDSTRGFMTVYYINKDGKAALYGEDQDILRRVIKDYLNADSAFARSLANPNVVLPIPVTSQ